MSSSRGAGTPSPPKVVEEVRDGACWGPSAPHPECEQLRWMSQRGAGSAVGSTPARDGISPGSRGQRPLSARERGVRLQPADGNGLVAGAPAGWRRGGHGVGPTGARTAPAAAPLVLICMFASDLPNRGWGSPGTPLASCCLACVLLSSFSYVSSLSDGSSLFQLFLSLTIFCISTSPFSFRAHAPFLSWMRLVTVPYSGCLCFQVHRDGSA